MDDRQARQLVVVVEEALVNIDRMRDAKDQVTANDAVQALVDLYGEALARVLQLVARTAPGDLFGSLVKDEVIGHVLMAHGLVPAPPEVLSARATGAPAAVSFLGRKPAVATP